MTKARDLADLLDGSGNLKQKDGRTLSGRHVKTDGEKLDGIEANATADQDHSEIRALISIGVDTNVFTDADHSKLNAIEASATADQTDAEIRAAVESAADSNVFTDADHTKLNAIEAGATADQTKSDIDALNIDADTLDGQHGSYYTGYTDTAVANIVDSSPAALDTLNELAAALGDDPNFATTTATNIGTKANKTTTLSAGSGLTGGGTLAANRTLNVGAGTGVTVNADTVAIGQDVGTSSNVTFNQVTADNLRISDWTGGDTYAAVSHSGMTGSEYMIISGNTDGNTYLSARTDSNVVIRGGNNVSNYEIKVLPNAYATAAGSTIITEAGSGLSKSSRTLSHSDTSSQASVNNSNGTVIQDITLDTFGHITGIASTNLDGRYYTETEADSRFVNVTGDTMSGTLTNNAGVTIKGQPFAAHMSGTSTSVNIGTYINDYAYIELNSSNDSGSWIDFSDASGADYKGRIRYVNSSNQFDIYTNATKVAHVNNTAFYHGSNRVFADNYHPNADKWTTARTLSLSGDASGSVSWDGSANATLSVTVADNSHSHSNYFPWYTSGSHNVNTQLGSGIYQGSTGGWSNRGPSGNNAGALLNINTHSGAYYSQLWFDTANSNFYHRSANNDSTPSAAWDKVWTSGNDGSGSGLDADLLDGVHGSSFLRSDADDTATGIINLTNKRTNFGASSSWDAVGFGNQTNLHMQGHNQFWVGAGNGTWFTGTANSRSQASGLAPDGGNAHDLLLTTMNSTSTYDRGITFGVDNTGAGNSGWRLGKWHSGDARDSSKLVIDGGLFAKGGYTDEYDYYGNDYSAYYSSRAGGAYWTGDSGWDDPSITASTAIQIQSGNAANNTRNPALQFHQVGYGGVQMRYDGPADRHYLAEATTGGRMNWARIQNSNGYIDFGPANSSWAHIYTDRGGFYFNQSLVSTGNITAYSDRKLKDNLVVLGNALDKVGTLTGYSYDRIDMETGRQAGLIAQDVQAVLPEAVITAEDDTLAVNYNSVVGLLVEAIKELKSEVEELKSKIEG